jgi:hypothetical protein
MKNVQFVLENIDLAERAFFQDKSNGRNFIEFP